VSKIIFGILAGLVVGAAAAWTFLKHHDTGDAAEPRKEESHEESLVVRTNDLTFVKLEKKHRELAGLKTAPLEAATLKPEVKAFGRVLDPAPLAAALAEIASARVALESSMREFNRLKVLHGQDQNVSTRVLDSAETAARRDQLLVQTAELKLLTAWGKPIASQPDLPAFVHALATLEAALVRVDVPLGETLRTPPVTTRIAAIAAPESPADAQFLGPAVSTDPQTQAQGFLFLLKNAALAPSSAVVAWLGAGGEEEKGVIVPRGALVRHQGDAFIYVEVSDELFERREVALEHPTDQGWFIDEGFKPGQRIVVVGAQQLLSAERKGQEE
jgi:hypothetical protein